MMKTFEKLDEIGNYKTNIVLLLKQFQNLFFMVFYIVVYLVFIALRYSIHNEIL